MHFTSLVRFFWRGSLSLRLSYASWASVLVLGISCCGSCRVDAAVFWEYWSTDGENSISGTFATDDGTIFLDPTGAELIQFTLSGFQTFRSNGSPVNFTGLPSGSPDASLAPLNVGEWEGDNQYKSFHWDSNARAVVNRETFEIWGWGEVLDRRGQSRYNEIALVYPESGSNSGLYYFREEPYSQWFKPTETSIMPITPVPESALWALVPGTAACAELMWHLSRQKRIVSNT